MVAVECEYEKKCKRYLDMEKRDSGRWFFGLFKDWEFWWPCSECEHNTIKDYFEKRKCCCGK